MLGTTITILLWSMVMTITALNDNLVVDLFGMSLAYTLGWLGHWFLISFVKSTIGK